MYAFVNNQIENNFDAKMKNNIYNENCLATMERMPDDFVDLTVTSPPYDDLRTYGGSSDFDFENICQSLYRVTKTGGVVVWVVTDQVIDGDESGSSFKQALYFKETGFKLFDTMIWEKAHFALSSNDSYFNVFEYMFVFTKGKIRTKNHIKDRINLTAGQVYKAGAQGNRTTKGDIKLRSKQINTAVHGKRGNIWRINTGNGKAAQNKIAHEHPAIFPEKLVSDHIQSWSNEGDVVYDPFLGSGTTAYVAKLLNRIYVGSEISPAYFELAQKRINDGQQSIFT